MIQLILLAIGAIILFGKKGSVNVNLAGSKLVGGQPLSNEGGTSTPTPTKSIPPFYMWKNAQSPQSPVTPLSFTPLDSVVPVDRLSAPHNNVILSGLFDISPSEPVRVPISGANITDTEQTSIALEQATSWQRNAVGGANVRQVIPLATAS